MVSFEDYCDLLGITGQITIDTYLNYLKITNQENIDE